MSSGPWIVIASAVGALAGFFGAYIERASRTRGEFVSAAAAWLAATEQLAIAADVDVLFSKGPTNRVGLALEWMAEKIEETLGEGRIELLRALVHRPLVRRVELVADRAMEASARLVLLAPSWTLRRIAPQLKLFDQWMNARDDPDLKRRWTEEARPEIARTLHLATLPLHRRMVARLVDWRSD